MPVYVQMKKIKLTLNTCVINTRRRIEAMNRLEKWHEQGIIEIQKTSAMDTEFKGWKPGLKKSKEYEEKPEIMRWDVSRWDHAVWGGEDLEDHFEEILKVLFPQHKNKSASEVLEKHKKDYYDSLHLATHKLYGNAIFVTTNTKHILRHKDQLKTDFGILVLTPEECCCFLEDHVFVGKKRVG